MTDFVVSLLVQRGSFYHNEEVFNNTKTKEMMTHTNPRCFICRTLFRHRWWLFVLLITPGSLTECYDELGNRYQLPVYCLAPPVNLISERSEEDLSDNPEPPTTQKKEFQLKVRLSTCKDVRLNASMTDTIGLLKKQLQAQEDIDLVHQRWFFSGKLLTDKTRLQDTKIQKDFVIQVIVNQQPTPDL